MKIIVCLIVPMPPPFGGISHWASLILRRVIKDNNIEMIPFDRSVRWRSVHDQSVAKRMLFGCYQLMFNLMSLCKLLRNRHISVIHLTTSGSLAVIRDLWILLVSKIFQVPLIYHIHHGRIPVIISTAMLEWRLTALMIKKSHSTIVIDGTTFVEVNKYIPNAYVNYIPNGIDLESFPSPEVNIYEKKSVMFLGWVIESKGIGELLEAWTNLDIPDWQLDIVGPCDLKYRNLLSDRFRTRGVNFIGELTHSEAMKLLGECEIFVLPSYTEGFPNVILEAMALGKAIVATDVGAIAEMLADKCGLLIPRRDAASLEVAMRNMMTNPKMRTEFGRCARNRVSELYGLDTSYKSYRSLWLKCSRY